MFNIVQNFLAIFKINQTIFLILIFLFKNFKEFIQFLKVTVHLQLLQNIGYIPHVVQFILEPILYSVVCSSHSPIPILTLHSHW